VRVANQQAQGNFLDHADEPEALADEDLPDDDEPQPISSALPTTPAAARAELRELNRLLDKLRALEGRDSKLERFFTELDCSGSGVAFSSTSWARCNRSWRGRAGCCGAKRLPTRARWRPTPSRPAPINSRSRRTVTTRLATMRLPKRPSSQPTVSAIWPTSF